MGEFKDVRRVMREVRDEDSPGKAFIEYKFKQTRQINTSGNITPRIRFENKLPKKKANVFDENCAYYNSNFLHSVSG